MTRHEKRMVSFEGDDGKTHQTYEDVEVVDIEVCGIKTVGYVRDAQRIDSDGFIKTVRAIDVPLTKSIYSGEIKTVEVSSDKLEKIRVKKDGSLVFNDIEIIR
ncbi:MAG: hypothetical protein WA139_01285 [Candidatus Aenigmatarchaeota archaeon]